MAKRKIQDRLIHESLDDNLAVIDDLIDRTSRMQIIRIMVTDSYDAYRIFETVNATGVDLSVADLLKNMVFEYLLEDEDSGEDIAQQKWASMKENLAEINVEVARFVRYHWILLETVTMEICTNQLRQQHLVEDGKIYCCLYILILSY